MNKDTVAGWCTNKNKTLLNAWSDVQITVKHVIQLTSKLLKVSFLWTWSLVLLLQKIHETQSIKYLAFDLSLKNDKIPLKAKAQLFILFLGCPSVWSKNFVNFSWSENLSFYSVQSNYRNITYLSFSWVICMYVALSN